MRKLQNYLLSIIGLFLFGMVLWVVERDALIGYALGVALISFSFFFIIERVGSRK
jgi:hypothetical protein